MGNFRKVLSIFLLGVLVIAKISSLHTFAHEDSDPDTIENCSWCHLAVTNQQADFQFTEIESTRAPEHPPVFLTKVSVQSPVFESTFFHSKLFSRPPPAV